MELTDEQLNNVAGGGSGNIPPEGIIFNSYTEVLENHYYSKEPNTNKVVYVYKEQDMYYTDENFQIDLNNNTWSTKSGPISRLVNNDFSLLFPFMLNIQP